MTAAAGIPVEYGADRVFVIKEESSFGVAPGTGSARELRRTSGMLNLKKDVITSNEKRSDFQVADSRHGTRRVEGQISQELWNGGSTEFWEALLMKPFAGVTTIAADTGKEFSASGGVLSRAADSMITAGLRNGMVVRFTGMGTNAVDRNWIVTGLNVSDGLSFTPKPVDGGAALADFTTDADGTIVIPGKRTYIPTTGHAHKSYYIEEILKTLDVSKLSNGCKVTSLGLRSQVNGMVTLDWGLLGLDQEEVSGGSSPYYVSPTAAGLGRAFSSISGILRANNAVVGVCTGLSLDIANGASPLPVVFRATNPDIPLGRALTVRGQFTGAVKDRAWNTLFRGETEFGLTLVLEAPAASGAPHFFAIDLPRVKANSQDEDDPDGAIIETVAIEALLCTATAAQDATTMSVQDSSL